MINLTTTGFTLSMGRGYSDYDSLHDSVNDFNSMVNTLFLSINIKD